MRIGTSEESRVGLGTIAFVFVRVLTGVNTVLVILEERGTQSTHSN